MENQGESRNNQEQTINPKQSSSIVEDSNVIANKTTEIDDQDDPMIKRARLDPDLVSIDSNLNDINEECSELIIVENVDAVNDEATEQSLDEGEIVDDDDDENDDGILLYNKDKKVVYKTEGFDLLKKTIKNEVNDVEENLILPIEENVNDGDSLIQNGNEHRKNELLKKQNSEEIASNYSDWSESEDDDLLKGDPTEIKSEPMDNDNEAFLVKEEIDLEAISDDDFDSEDVYNKTNDGSGVGEFEKLFPKDSFNQISDKDQIEEISILDTLKIDWKSLMSDKTTDSANNDDQNDNKQDEEMVKKTRSEQFRKQNSTIAMLNRVGFSHRFAGEKMTKLINQYLLNNLGDEYYQPMLHPIPALHAFYKNKQNQNEHILGPSNGPNVVMSGDKDRLFHELVNYPFL